MGKEYLPIDHAGPILFLTVLSREPRDAGALIVAIIKVHTGSIISTAGRGASPDVWGGGERKPELVSPSPRETQGQRLIGELPRWRWKERPLQLIKEDPK